MTVNRERTTAWAVDPDLLPAIAEASRLEPHCAGDVDTRQRR